MHTFCYVKRLSGSKISITQEEAERISVAATHEWPYIYITYLQKKSLFEVEDQNVHVTSITVDYIKLQNTTLLA